MSLETNATEVLRQTSRTFYLSIIRLPAPLKEAIISAYLSFRAIDEIEDHAELDKGRKIDLLSSISRKYQDYKTGHVNDFCTALHGHRDSLPEVTNRLDEWLRLAPKTIAPRIIEVSANMAYHMAHWVGNDWRVRTRRDLDCYTFSVAGLVGLLLSDLWVWYDGTKTRREGIVRLKAEDVIRLFMRHNPPMRTSVTLYPRHRFPAEIISHCVWLYFRFTLSFRDVEEMLAMRGVALTYETVREWCLKFGQTYANGLRHKSPRPGDRWHLDEVFLKINGRLHYLWRAVDQDGDVLDILVQIRRDKKAAKKFFRKLLKGLRYVPRVLITDKLKSYGAARAEVMPSVEHLQQKYQNNRAENSHQPTRLREKVMRRFKSSGHAQRFLSAFGIIT